MTIQNANILRAILDGETVQYEVTEDEALHPGWATLQFSAEHQIRWVLAHPDRQFRVKPTPEVQWVPVWRDALVGEARSVRSAPGGARPIQWLRLEFVDGKCVSAAVEDAE